mgnify:CR=1 FL=1
MLLAGARRQERSLPKICEQTPPVFGFKANTDFIRILPTPNQVGVISPTLRVWTFHVLYPWCIRFVMYDLHKALTI